jgi:hypothetical protein
MQCKLASSAVLNKILKINIKLYDIDLNVSLIMQSIEFNYYIVMMDVSEIEERISSDHR